MAASILWAPGIFLSAGKLPVPIKFLLLAGVVVLLEGGVGSANFILMAVGFITSERYFYFLRL